MIIENKYPQSIDWTNISEEKHMGESGYAIIKTKRFGDTQIRKIEYSKDYKADHWCDKGHIVCVMEGELTMEYKEHDPHVVKSGMNYIVGSNTLLHKAVSKNGAIVLIID